MQTTTSGRGKMPPYVSYPSFKTLMHDFSEHDVPTRIDRSVLTRFSGIVGTQLLTALRFLGLIDDKSQPTDRLRDLVASYGTGDWAQKLLAILREEYAPMFELDLGAATSSHFTETFHRAFPSKSEAVSQKCVAFFLGAVRDTGIAISERVLKGKKPRAANGSAPRPRKPRPLANGDINQGVNPPPKDPIVVQQSASEFMTQLLSKFPTFDPSWPDNIKQEWFKGFQQLMEHAKADE